MLNWKSGVRNIRGHPKKMRKNNLREEFKSYNLKEIDRQKETDFPLKKSQWGNSLRRRRRRK